MSLNVETQLRTLLSDSHRIAVIGVGSAIRGDDRAGLLVARLLQHRCRNRGQLRAFVGETAPENLVGEIRRYSPSHTLLVDAAHTGATPGTIDVIQTHLISGLSASTHAFPINVFAEYLRQSLGCKVILVGIQPGSLELNRRLAPDVASAARRIVDILLKIVTDRCNELSCSMGES